MIGSLVPRRPASGSYWPFFTVKEVLNVAESNFRFAPKADIQNIRLGSEPNVRFWPKAAVG